MGKKIVDGIMAGILISIGGTVYLACENKIAGAVLFAVALLGICMENYSLFTGRVCYIADHPTKDTVSALLLGLLGNLMGTVLCGRAIRYALPAIGEAAEAACNARLNDQVFAGTLIRAIFCGVLIFLAVDIFKKGKGAIGIVFCIPVFILCGFEHSVADMFYFAASDIVSAKAFGFIMTVILGNAIGGLLLPNLAKIQNRKGE